MDDKNSREETGAPLSRALSGHIETFIALQNVSQQMFHDAKDLDGEAYDILLKTARRSLSDKPTRFNRK